MNLRKKIFNEMPKIPEGIEVFLFGSTLITENVNDIDLALVYNSKTISIEQILEFRKSVKQRITETTGIECQIIAMSNEENMELEFIQNIKSEKVKSASS